MSWLRWKLSKIWQCPIDDPRFENISTVQWIFYASMISRDQKEENDKYLEIVEYLASFWNPDAVRKIREARSQKEHHAFPDDIAYEKELAEQKYKDNPIIKRILEQRKNVDTNYNDNYDNNKQNTYASGVKLPTDLSAISKIIRKK